MIKGNVFCQNIVFLLEEPSHIQNTVFWAIKVSSRLQIFLKTFKSSYEK